MLDASSDAPGADDDASGTAAVLECAHILSQHRFAATIVYGGLVGEEQGLYGGTVLAHYARDHHWKVEADLNNDIVGNSRGDNGAVDANHVRLFSEGTRSLETPDEATQRRTNGGELDSPSRNLARFVSTLAERYLTDFHGHMVYRTDRYGRSGDQVPMLAAGFPAVRLTEAAENYTHEHQTPRVENGIPYGDVLSAVNFIYLAQVTRLNAVALAALASAPARHRASRSRVRFPGIPLELVPMAGAANYRVWWRDTLAPYWTDSRDAVGATQLTLKNTNIDDYFFGVSVLSPDGYERPVVFPSAAGTFRPP